MKKKTVFFISILLICIVLLYAVGAALNYDTTKSAYNPVLDENDYSWSSYSPDNPCILRDPETGEPALYNNKYWMATDCHDGRTENDDVGLYTSTDLINWTQESNNPVASVDDADAHDWEYYLLAFNEFFDMRDIPGTIYDFWAFYVVEDSDQSRSVNVIKSNDMVNWDRSNVSQPNWVNPVVDWTCSWGSNSDGAEDFRVCRLSNGTWAAIYENDQSDGATGMNVGIAFSNASLPHMNWTDKGATLTSTPDGGSFCANPCMIRGQNGSWYYVFYEWSSGPDEKTYGMYTSEDNLFVKDSWVQFSNPVVESSPTGWEDNTCIPNCVINNNGTFMVYYTGSSGGSTAVGLAYIDVENETAPTEDESSIDFSPSITSINGQGNNTVLYTEDTSLVWLRDPNATSYCLQVANSTSFSSPFIDLSNITISGGWCSNVWLNTSSSDSPRLYNYWENSTHCTLYLPWSMNITWSGSHHYRYRSSGVS